MSIFYFLNILFLTFSLAVRSTYIYWKLYCNPKLEFHDRLDIMRRSLPGSVTPTIPHYFQQRGSIKRVGKLVYTIISFTHFRSPSEKDSLASRSLVIYEWILTTSEKGTNHNKGLQHISSVCINEVWMCTSNSTETDLTWQNRWIW